MTALEDARAAERGLTFTIDSAVRMGGCPTREMYAARDALRALIAEHERLTAPPADDEREALRDELAGWVIGAGYYQSMVGTSDAAEMADAILAAGFRRQGPITDAQVEAATEAAREADR